MNLKEFIKPTILKIVLLIILMGTTFLIFGKICNPCPWESWNCVYPSWCNKPITLVYYFIFIIPNYLLSCLMVHAYIKLKKK